MVFSLQTPLQGHYFSVSIKVFVSQSSESRKLSNPISSTASQFLTIPIPVVWLKVIWWCVCYIELSPKLQTRTTKDVYVEL